MADNEHPNEDIKIKNKKNSKESPKKLKNPLNLIKKANQSFNLYLKNLNNVNPFLDSYQKNQEKLDHTIENFNKKNEILYQQFQKKERIARAKTIKEMPFIQLEKKHTNNAKILLNREEMLKSFPKNCICAEIGVAAGDFSKMIFQINRPQKLHLVDAWHSERYDSSLESLVKQKFAQQIESKIIILNKGLSIDILPEFEDHYFDWVYIDTVHDYSITAQELAICREKVKHGGIIAGHDFNMGNWIDSVKYGVENAVYEFCKKYDWEILYITAELGSKSFAIRKIAQ